MFRGGGGYIAREVWGGEEGSITISYPRRLSARDHNVFFWGRAIILCLVWLCFMGALFLYIRFGSQILTLLHEHIHVLGDTLFTYG